MLINIQFLRFAAAMLVVLFHCADHLRAAGHAPGALFSFAKLAGFAGVDIFFVISGFIMVWTTRHLAGGRAAGEFARRRVARIYSGYWPFYLLAIGLFSLMGGAWLANVDYLGSALLWPTHLRNLLIPVSWTLIFEMVFYLLFTGLIAAGLAQRALALAALAAGALAWTLYSQLVRHAYDPGHLEAMSVYEQYLAFPYLLEFLAGSLLALFLRARPSGLAWTLLAVGVGLFLAGTWVNGQFFDGRLIQGYFVTWRVLLFGTASLFLVAGLVRLDHRGRLCPRRFSVWAGGASYALYLGHTLVLAGAHSWGLDAWLSGWQTPAARLGYGLVALLLLVASILWYHWIERPLHRGFRRILRV